MIKILLKHFFRTWKHHSTMQLATLTVLIGTYSVVGVSFLIHQNLDSVLTRWGDTVRMSVYLDSEVSSEQKKKIEEELKSSKDFKEVAYISKEDAADKFQKQMSSFLPDLIFDEDFKNPLPESFELNLASTASASNNFDKLVSIAKKISGYDGVEDVSYGQGWVENYASVVDSFSATSIFLILTLLGGSLFVVGNSIRNSVAQRREELEVLELVGASISHIRMPFIFEGAIIGLIASVASVIVTFALYNWQQALVNEGLSFWTMGMQFHFLSGLRVFSLLMLGVALGSFGSYLCVRKMCNGWTAAERSI